MIETAQRVLAVDLSMVPATRTVQFVVGWTRAAFEESRAIAVLTREGLAHAAAPNRRSFAELILRLQWLHSVKPDQRAGALDGMIEEEKGLTRKFYGHLKHMGYDAQPDLSDMEQVLTDVIQDGRLVDQAKRILAAAKATDGAAIGMYYAWREETQYMHATAQLAAAYAPEIEGRLGSGRPPVVDLEFEGHRTATVLAVALAYRLLVEEGVDEHTASLLIDAFFG
ncbi:hypothetical protein H4J02_06645 [Protaetiibacter sp. SSC-01]|uniref:hypothetical protein n=1 Tax=Protaetiibacter sp. SSC-01 TaxID=2759943 RepID=UPI0016574753|nr:hypothetical protein [Protaetiibacter sp. SSC-01]QNO38664.1 hypothetical protein H4J02_06645 [Protaetiibacter sp. SSC-01]